jgi:hypothetical protein
VNPPNGTSGAAPPFLSLRSRISLGHCDFAIPYSTVRGRSQLDVEGPTPNTMPALATFSFCFGCDGEAT